MIRAKNGGSRGVLLQVICLSILPTAMIDDHAYSDGHRLAIRHIWCNHLANHLGRPLCRTSYDNFCAPPPTSFVAGHSSTRLRQDICDYSQPMAWYSLSHSQIHQPFEYLHSSSHVISFHTFLFVVMLCIFLYFLSPCLVLLSTETSEVNLITSTASTLCIVRFQKRSSMQNTWRLSLWVVSCPLVRYLSKFAYPYLTLDLQDLLRLWFHVTRFHFSVGHLSLCGYCQYLFLA